MIITKYKLTDIKGNTAYEVSTMPIEDMDKAYPQFKVEVESKHKVQKWIEV